MTAEEQIKEVMELVQDFADYEYALGISNHSESERMIPLRKKARDAIEAKLRNLIKDEA